MYGYYRECTCKHIRGHHGDEGCGKCDCAMFVRPKSKATAEPSLPRIRSFRPRSQ